MIDLVTKNKILILLTLLISLGVLIFDIFHFSNSYGIVEINNVNALLLVPFILLVCGLGMVLGDKKNSEAVEIAYKERLSDREREVVELVCSGKKNQEIADDLFVDISTVKSHINKIYKKTGLKNRKELRFYGDRVLQKGEFR